MRKQSHLFLDLHRAARGGASETLSSLLEIVVASEISLTAEGNATLLHSASENGRLECVRILREGYVPINIRDDRGKTPLMKAVENSHLDVVNELLLADDLDPKIADYNGETALHISSRLGDMKRMKHIPYCCTTLFGRTRISSKFISSNKMSSTENNVSTLQLLQVVSRHGARTPFNGSYPNDPNVDFLSLGKGQLTWEGTVQMYEYGQTIRRRYNNFLKNDYRTVLARSSTIPRCIQSGAAMLSAIYPKPSLFNYNSVGREQSQNLIQPIPIYADEGILYPSDANNLMGKLEDMFNQLFSSEFMLKLKADVATVIGRENVTAGDLVMLADSLKSESFHNMTLPPWYSTLNPRLNRLMSGTFGGSMISRFRGRFAGGLLKDIVTNLDVPQLTNDTEVQINSFYYFTHDIVVGALLSCLNVPLEEQPSFGATVLIEKHLLDKDSFVRFFYLDSPDAEPKLLILPGCQDSSGECTILELKYIINGLELM